MKILFVGIGSIGKRHIKNLTSILMRKGVEFSIHALRSSRRVLDTDISNLIEKSFFDYSDLSGEYDIAFITNPTVSHFSTLKNIIPHAKHLFIEKPLFENTSYNLSDLRFGNGINYVACPMRYTGVFDKLKNFIAENKVYSARAICSTYLPDWRPGQDYSKVYSAIKEMGGGVAIDLIHEWDYLTYLFGMPEKVIAFDGTYSNLKINSDDLYTAIARYEDKIIELHLDYFGRIPTRKIELYTGDDTVTFDFIKSEIVSGKGSKIEKIVEEVNDRYIKEMESFLNMIDGKFTNINSVDHAFSVQKMIESSIVY